MAQSAESAATPPNTWLGRHRRLLLVGGPVVLVIVGVVVYLTGGRYAATDDAYLQAARVEISSNVAGRVVEVDVHDNQVVHANDVLFQIDPRPFQIAIQDAEAQLAGARLRIKGLEASYLQRQADEKAAKNTIAYRQDDYDRKKKLAADGITSRAQLDQSAHDLDVARGGPGVRHPANPRALSQISAATSPRPWRAGLPCARRRPRWTVRSSTTPTPPSARLSTASSRRSSNCRLATTSTR